MRKRCNSERRLVADPPDRSLRDSGTVLPMLLVMMVIGSLIVLPLMSYAMTVMKANHVLSEKTQRYEAVKAGLRSSLFNPLQVYRDCEDWVDGSEEARTVNTVTVNGVVVKTTCQAVGFGSTVNDDHPRFGLVATEMGQTVPAELKGNKFPNEFNAAEVNLEPDPEKAPRHELAPADWAGAALSTRLYANPGNPDQWNKIWLPHLPSIPDTVRQPPEGGYRLEPPTLAHCRVFFPGRYLDDLDLRGDVFFTSGIYYFEGEVRVHGGANVIVGDGRFPGCVTSQEAVFHVEDEPPIDEHNITGFGATWLFGGEGRLVVSDAEGPVQFQFNRRYVQDGDPDPSLYVSIASVNGALKEDGGLQDLVVGDRLHVPASHVVVSGDTTEWANEHNMNPSTLTAAPAAPAQPTFLSQVPFKTGTSSNQGGAYLTWRAPAVEEWGGSKIVRYEITRRGTAQTQVVNAAGASINKVYSAVFTGLPGSSNSTSPATTEFDLVAVNELGQASPPIATSVTVTSSSSSQSQPGPPAAPTAPTRYKDGFLVTVAAPSSGVPAPIVKYTVTAHSTGSGNPQVGDSCEIDMRVLPPLPTLSCTIRGLNPNTKYKLKVKAENPTNSRESSLSSDVSTQNNAGAAAPAPVAPPAPPEVPPHVPVPIVDIDLGAEGDATSLVRIPGYIAIPQGIFRVENPSGRNVQVIGGILAAQFEVNDGRAAGEDCSVPPVTPTVPPWEAGKNCVDLGFEADAVQVKLRLVSTTSSGHETSVAIVQVNENGAYAVNSWEVQS